MMRFMLSLFLWFGQRYAFFRSVRSGKRDLGCSVGSRKRRLPIVCAFLRLFCADLSAKALSLFSERRTRSRGSFDEMKNLLFVLAALLGGCSGNRTFVPSNPLDVELGDPYVLLASDGRYYMYGTGGVRDGFGCYVSDDLTRWEYAGAVYRGNTPESWAVANFWAPEVYERDGRFYMFFNADWRENPTGALENFRIGVVTCCATLHFKTIHAASGLAQFFDFVIKGEEFVHHKPHPEPYLLALSRSDSLPENCIAVEDSQRGVESAKNAGLRVAALSCVTNPAAGLSAEQLCHEEVLAATEAAKPRMAALVTAFVEALP